MRLIDERDSSGKIEGDRKLGEIQTCVWNSSVKQEAPTNKLYLLSSCRVTVNRFWLTGAKTARQQICAQYGNTAIRSGEADEGEQANSQCKMGPEPRDAVRYVAGLKWIEAWEFGRRRHRFRDW